MAQLKVTSWNVEHLDRLTAPNLSASAMKRRNAVAGEIQQMSPHVLCVLEGPKGEAAIDKVCTELLAGDYVAVKAPDGQYDTLGTQWIWFLLRKELATSASLLPVSTWDAFTSGNWPVHYWGEQAAANHSHYRHPQVLVLEVHGVRVEFIGLHLKSKFVNQGQSMWNAGGTQREQFVREALKARIKLATEATNVRAYIDSKFEQTVSPAIFVMGDLNDGPGKELFEERYLFFDLVSNVQGDVFFARRFLNHALFDYPENLRWTVKFTDFVDPTRDPHILLDHILFTQPLVDGSLPLVINSHAGFVEHEVHELINAPLTSSQKTSDHRPVSVVVTTPG